MPKIKLVRKRLDEHSARRLMRKRIKDRDFKSRTCRCCLESPRDPDELDHFFTCSCSPEVIQPTIWIQLSNANHAIDVCKCLPCFMDQFLSEKHLFKRAKLTYKVQGDVRYKYMYRSGKCGVDRVYVTLQNIVMAPSLGKILSEQLKCLSLEDKTTSEETIVVADHDDGTFSFVGEHPSF